jgi:hypothetical protein
VAAVLALGVKPEAASAGTAWKWHDGFAYGTEIPLTGDFDGDGKYDIVSFTCGRQPQDGDVYVALSTSQSFSGTNLKWHDGFCFNAGSRSSGTSTATEGRHRVVHLWRQPQDGDVYVALSTGRSFEVWAASGTTASVTTRRSPD